MVKKGLIAATIIWALAVSNFFVFAADPPAKPAVPTLDQVLETSGVSLGGYIDTAYSHLSGTGAFSSNTANRVFDTEPNSFNLHQAAIVVAKQPKEGFGGLVNITVGNDAQVIHSFDEPVGPQTNRFDVTQAFAQYGQGPLTVIVGKYVTNAGAEVINSTSDVNYSRSILFGYAIPFTHTGLRATYAVNDMLSVIGGVNNGWDQIKDANKQKTLELGLTVAPTKTLSFAVTDYAGSEPVDIIAKPTGTQGMRNILDLVGTWTASDKLSVTLNYDYGSQDNAVGGTGKAKWTGLAAYANYQFTDTWRLSVRGEYFNDKNGYRTGVVQKWKEGTITLAYLPTKSMEIRGELRGDKSDQSSFLKSDGSASKTQSSYGVEAIYKF